MEPIILEQSGLIWRLAKLGGYKAYSERTTCAYYTRALNGLVLALAAAASIFLFVLWPAYEFIFYVKDMIVAGRFLAPDSPAGLVVIYLVLFAVAGAFWLLDRVCKLIAMLWYRYSRYQYKRIKDEIIAPRSQLSLAWEAITERVCRKIEFTDRKNK